MKGAKIKLVKEDCIRAEHKSGRFMDAWYWRYWYATDKGLIESQMIVSDPMWGSPKEMKIHVRSKARFQALDRYKKGWG